MSVTRGVERIEDAELVAVRRALKECADPLVVSALRTMSGRKRVLWVERLGAPTKKQMAWLK